jgi:hypothetical protein
MTPAHKALGPLTSDSGRRARSHQAVAANESCTDAPTRTAVCCRWLRSLQRRVFMSFSFLRSRPATRYRSDRMRAPSVLSVRYRRRETKVPLFTTPIPNYEDLLRISPQRVATVSMMSEQHAGGWSPIRVPAEQGVADGPSGPSVVTTATEVLPMSPTGGRTFTDTPAFSKPTSRHATPRSGGGDTPVSAGTSADNNRALVGRPLRQVTSATVGPTRAQTDQFNDPCNYLG